MVNLFESKKAKAAREEAKAKVAMNMGRNKIRNFVNRCQASSSKYRQMAKKALKLGNRPQAEHFIANQLQYDNQSNRWECFLMKLDDIQLRGEAMGAMTGMMDGLSDMCASIGQGISAEGIEKTMVQLQTSMAKVDQAESHVMNMMEGLSFNVGPESLEMSSHDLPASLREEVSSVCDSLLDELQVEGSVFAGRATQRSRAGVSPSEDKIQDQLDAQMERLRQLRKQRETR